MSLFASYTPRPHSENRHSENRTGGRGLGGSRGKQVVVIVVASKQTGQRCASLFTRAFNRDVLCCCRRSSPACFHTFHACTHTDAQTFDTHTHTHTHTPQPRSQICRKTCWPKVSGIAGIFYHPSTHPPIHPSTHPPIHPNYTHTEQAHTNTQTHGHTDTHSKHAHTRQRRLYRRRRQQQQAKQWPSCV